jgi:hypothetical protein
MTRLLLEAWLAARLSQSDQPVELCDPTGNVVGTFLPRSLHRCVSVPYTEAELDAAEKEPGGYSLAEILADLEKS